MSSCRQNDRFLARIWQFLDFARKYPRSTVFVDNSILSNPSCMSRMILHDHSYQQERVVLRSSDENRATTFIMFLHFVGQPFRYLEWCLVPQLVFPCPCEVTYVVAVVFYMGFEILGRPKDGKDGYVEDVNVEDVKGLDTEAFLEKEGWEEGDGKRDLTKSEGQVGKW